MNNGELAFLGIGAQRAATTWLHDCLSRHPEIYVPNKKEVHFFDEQYDRGWDWYADHFKEAIDGQIRGEITPNYLDFEEAAARIARECPNVKLFAILREPVSRAISSYELLGHKFKERTFEEACQPGKYVVELGLYAKHLKRFRKYFSPNQLKVFLLEDIKHQPSKVLDELCEFIGVSRGLIAPDEQSNKTNSVAFPRVQGLLTRMGLGRSISLLKSSPLSQPVRRLAQVTKRRKTVGYDREKLRAIFREDIIELQTLIDRDLSHWLAEPRG